VVFHQFARERLDACRGIVLNTASQVYVAKDPIAWVASAIRRPHFRDRRAPKNIERLLKQRAHAARGVEELRLHLEGAGGSLEVVAGAKRDGV